MFLWIQTEGAFQVALVLTTLPANSGDKSTCRLDLLIGKISWRIAWQPTSEFLLGNPMEGSLVGCTPVGPKEIDRIETT